MSCLERAEEDRLSEKRLQQLGFVGGVVKTVTVAGGEDDGPADYSRH
jgi:hypothetical protein